MSYREVRRLSGRFLVVALALAGLAACGGDSGDGSARGPDSVVPPEEVSERMLPIVFVHGVAGSAQQYQTQVMRFEANGYPADRIHAFEYNGGLPGVVQAAAAGFALELLDFINEVRAEHDVEAVYLVGHSLGTIISTEFLTLGTITGLIPGVDGPSDVVAKYVAIDGLLTPVCPGLVPCLGVYDGERTDISGPEREEIENQAHVLSLIHI